jgi:hypothetical protein
MTDFDATDIFSGLGRAELPPGIEKRVSIFGAPLPPGYGSADCPEFDYDSRGRLVPSPARPSTTRFIHYPFTYPPNSAASTTEHFSTVRMAHPLVSINAYAGWEFALSYD